MTRPPNASSPPAPPAPPAPSAPAQSGQPPSCVVAAGICHRVKNDFQTMSTLLALAASRAGSAQELVSAFESRVAVLSTPYSLVAHNGDLPSLPDLISQVSRRCRARYPGAPQVAIAAPMLRLSMRICSPLALWLGEVLDNALGHGQAAAKGGLDVSCGNDDGMWLRVRDRGPGPPMGLDLDTSQNLGLGLTVAKALAEVDLRGSMEIFHVHPGLEVFLRVDADQLELLNATPWT